MNARTWTDLVARIRECPAMYLGSRSLQAFEMYVHGFRMAEGIYGNREQRDHFNDFRWYRFAAHVAALHNKRAASLASFGLAQYEAQGQNMKTFDARQEYPGSWEISWQWYAEYVIDASQTL